jgi:hypothetical protein
MRHRVLVSLLTIAGLASIGVGIHRVYGHCGYGHCGRHPAFEQRVADICVQAAQRTIANHPNPSSKP